MTRNPWSKDDIRLLCKLRRQGKSVRELCAYFGRHRQSIYTALKRKIRLPQYLPLSAISPPPAKASLGPTLRPDYADPKESVRLAELRRIASREAL